LWYSLPDALKYNMTMVVTKIEDVLWARLHSNGVTSKSLLTESTPVYQRKLDELFSYIDRKISTFVVSKIETHNFVLLATGIRFTCKETGKDMFGDVVVKGDDSKDVYRTFGVDEALPAEAWIPRTMAVDGDLAWPSAVAEGAEHWDALIWGRPIMTLRTACI
jgi:hypothetical protein